MSNAGFIVDNQQIGVRSAKIQNKLALRIVENCDIVFTDVHIPGRHHLPGATSFKKGVETMLKHTRIIVMWNVVGGCIGVYKAMLKYATTRKQFNGNFIAAYQLVQEKIVKVLSNL